jgi:hypothetical protein
VWFGGGCSGWSYKLDFDTLSQNRPDQVFEANHIQTGNRPEKFSLLCALPLSTYDGFEREGISLQQSECKPNLVGAVRKLRSVKKL